MRQMQEKDEMRSQHENDPFKVSNRIQLSNGKSGSVTTERRKVGGTQEEFMRLQTLIHESQKVDKKIPYKGESTILLA